MQRRQGFTTMVDIEEFRKTKWTFLTNIKMTWQYKGISYKFREEGIPLYGKDLGTTKMNHPIMTMALPQHRDTNFGVDIYVPTEHKKRAEKIISDMDKVKYWAELEEEAGPAYYEAFNELALENKRRHAEARSKRRFQSLAQFIPFLGKRQLAANSENE